MNEHDALAVVGVTGFLLCLLGIAWCGGEFFNSIGAGIGIFGVELLGFALYFDSKNKEKETLNAQENN